MHALGSEPSGYGVLGLSVSIFVGVMVCVGWKLGGWIHEAGTMETDDSDCMPGDCAGLVECLNAEGVQGLRPNHREFAVMCCEGVQVSTSSGGWHVVFGGNKYMSIG